MSFLDKFLNVMRLNPDDDDDFYNEDYDYDDEEDFWERIKEEVTRSCDGRIYRPTAKLVELIEDYDRDCWEWLYHCGERIDTRVYLWVYSFDQVLRQLGYVGGGKNGSLH